MKIYEKFCLTHVIVPTRRSLLVSNSYQHITTALQVLVGEVFNLDTQEGDGGHLIGTSKWNVISAIYFVLIDDIRIASCTDIQNVEVEIRRAPSKSETIP